MTVNKENYEASKRAYDKLNHEYDSLRSTEAARTPGTNERKKLKEMGQAFSDLQMEIIQYEVANGIRPEGAFVTTKEIR